MLPPQFDLHDDKTLENLEENDMSVMTFQEEDFIVINEEFFVFINDLKTIPLRENGSFTLRNIFEKTRYIYSNTGRGLRLRIK